MKKKILYLFIVFASLFIIAGCKKKTDTTMIRVGTSEYGTHINPFFYETRGDINVLKLLYLKLFPTTREGKTLYNAGANEGEVSEGFTYYGAASMKVQEEDGYYNYIITLNENIYSSDGEQYTTKDLLFDYYVLFDPSSEKESYQSLPLEGLSEFIEIVNNMAQDNNDEEEKPKPVISGLIYSKKNITLKMTRELNDDEKELLNIYLAPLSAYGDSKLFAPSEYSYGYQLGDAASIKRIVALDKASTGPYKLTAYSKDSSTLEKNSASFLTTSTVKKIKIIRIHEFIYDEDGFVKSGGDEFYQIDKDKIDIAEVVINEKTLDEVPRYNSNSDLVGNVLTLYQYEGGTRGIIYSSKRIKRASLDSLHLTENYNLYDELKSILK